MKIITDKVEKRKNKSWKKGVSVGFSVGLVLSLMLIATAYFLFMEDSESVEVGCIYQKDCMVPLWAIFFVNFVFYIIPASLIGGLIGYFFDKKSNYVKSKSK